MADQWMISTNLARCRDCYRCVRACHVKAVRVKGGQAQVVPELCIACGSCVAACPQKAKSVRDDRPAIRKAMKSGRTVVATVAPSLPAYFSLRTFCQLEEALKGLGFTAAEETAFGAEMVGLAHRELIDGKRGPWPVITSSCPGIVNLIEKYYPDLIPYLAPIVSPMIAHGRWLRERFGKDAYLVFIGPCIAKKGEILERMVAGVIDAVLTFDELREWMEADQVTLGPEPQVTGEARRSEARLFPVEGGLLATAGLNTDLLALQTITASGLDACQDVLVSIRSGRLGASLVELLACEGGCINGPALRGRESIFLARQRVLEFGSRRARGSLPPRGQWPSLDQAYEDQSVPVPRFTEEQIREVLQVVEKYAPEDELNCGACGYPTCRDKAVATLRGMAEATMCIPYMRRRSESLRQVVMDVGPNPIIIVDRDLRVQDMSTSAEKMFDVRLASVAGQPLQSFMPVVDGFLRVRETGEPIPSETIRLHGDLIVEQTIVPVRDQRLLLGILRDVTDRERGREQLERLRNETLGRTREVVKNQMRVAQEIAQLLGETTAETKMMFSRLAKLLEEGTDA